MYLRSKHVPAFALVFLVFGCMSPTPYTPRLDGQVTGYTDRSLAENRYRVTFTGNSATPRETVESYLLLRAAEVAQAAGYNHFVFDTRNTNMSTYGGRSGFSFGTGFGFGSGRFGSGWGSGIGFGYSSGANARANHEAYAEIVFLTPQQAAQETRAINARDVIDHMEPQTKRR
jgi:hypothetical protein